MEHIKDISKIGNNQLQDILEELGMIDENSNCPYTAEEILRAGMEYAIENKMECSLESHAPIPITPEILEKNGFEASEVNEGSYIWKAKTERAIWDEEGNVTIRSVKCDALFQGHCYYVHQLQDALRLCGIEKEIEQ